MLGVGLEFGAERGDVIVYRAGGGECGVTPDDIEESFAGDGLAIGFSEEPEHGELAGGQVQRGAIADGGLSNQVDVNRAESQIVNGFAGCLGTTQQCAHASQQFARTEWFDEIVVGARVEPGNAIFDLALGGEHENGHGNGEPAQLGAEGEAIELRQHDIEQDEIRFLLEGTVEAGGTVGGGEDAISFGGQGVLEGDAHGAFVFDDEDAGARSEGVRRWHGGSGERGNPERRVDKGCDQVCDKGGEGTGLVGESSWDVQRKFAAVTRLALDGYATSVGRDDVANDGEADADAGGFTAQFGAASVERFENLLVLGRRDAFTRIANPDAKWRDGSRQIRDGIACSFWSRRIERQADFDGAMEWGMFDGVVDEIDERLLNRPSIQYG